jgi:FlaA1/EpsC-like NDP-sugar epimerase
MGVARTVVTLGLVALAWLAGFVLRFDGDIPTERTAQMLVALPAVLLLQYVALRMAGADRHSWRYTDLFDLLPLIAAVGATSAVLVLLRILAPGVEQRWDFGELLVLPYGVIGIYAVAATGGLAGGRMLRRVQTERQESGPRTENGDRRRVLLLGAGRAGSLVARELASRPDLGMRAIGFVDDDRAKHGYRIAGLDVLGTSDDLERLIERHRIDDVVITIAAAGGPTMRRLVERCEAAGKLPQVVPGVSELLTGQVSLNWFRPVQVEDLLGRDPVELELDTLEQLLRGEVVLVTGAGGSIGAELARQVARFAPATLVLAERSEPALWAIHRDLQQAHPRLTVVPAVADVTDRCRMDALLVEHRPSVLLHAAAHKHVPMMEDNPGEAIKNNVLGTRTMVDLAHERDVTRFVLISTDKAVNPTSVMGATKRLAERYVQHVADETGRPYVSVRFGNVLGSTGSVVPVFKEQIHAGGPVTVTHPEMQRYFMTIPEASQLVLQAAALGGPGEILVLDMGEPVRIVELAESLIRLSGLEPYDDIDIAFTGLRPGEKLFEELSLAEEGATATRHPKVFIGNTPTPSWPEAPEELTELGRVTDRLEAHVLRKMLAAQVPEFLLDSPLPDHEGSLDVEGANEPSGSR